ncbi:MAG: periplasmic divalent cation tolerance protein [Solirubrobacterales bacterium]|jgi:periplasmic divalent cation tolerance protein|nr:periplasmic divalent cation tolerance protein [Solirubrobacterales bacterium]
MAECVQAVTTVGSEEEARVISRALVEARLAACVQIVGPIRSRYRWQGKMEEATEWQCLIKTTRGAYMAAETVIKGLHSYDEPEIIAMPIVAGSEGYLAWIEENVD